MQELSNSKSTASDADAADLAEIDCADLVDACDIAEDATAGQLQEELAKWRERVPRLAAALRERTVESQRLQNEVEELRRQVRSGGQRTDAKESNLQGKIHSRDQEIAELRQDVETLHSRCQGLTEALNETTALVETREQRLDRARSELRSLTASQDEKIALLEEREHELVTLREEASSLAERNAKLFETTELASRQMETLGASLDQLRDDVRQRDGQLDSMRAELEGRDREMAGLQARAAELEARLANSGPQDQQAQEQLRQQLARREQELDAMADSLAEQRAEVKRLEGCLEDAERVTHEREDERRLLSKRIAEMEEHKRAIEAELEESAARAARLTDEVAAGDEQHAVAANATQELEQENRRLAESLAKAERRVEDLVERTGKLDARLERQKELMLNLEEELADTQDEYASEQKQWNQRLAERERELADLKDELDAGQSLVDDSLEQLESAQERVAELEQMVQPVGDAAEVDELTRQVERELAAAKAAAEAGSGTTGAEAEVLRRAVHKLEQMLRDRTEQLNKLKWQHNMAAREDAANPESGNKMLMVLNQQLTDARESNDRLSARIRELELQLASAVD